MRRWTGALAAVVLVGANVLFAAPAHAIGPPEVPPGPPPSGPVAPPDPTEQKTLCGQGAVLPGTQFRRRPAGDVMLDYTAAWRYGRGAGQKVAVIDTGVAPNPRLTALQGGGDYVSASDGLVDCDVHGTLVAGLIAAAPSPDDGFAGVAPEAAILSIRQNSGVFATKGSSSSQDDPNALSPGYGNTRTLALAIVRAVDLGATVINLSEAACAPVGVTIDDAAVGQAVRYAFERNVVVVAAAGNIAGSGQCSQQNVVRDPNLPLAQAWDTVRTVASPAWFSDFVLTVAAVAPDSTPAEFSLQGPWVDVAAPGEQITSLSPNGPGLVDALLDPQGSQIPINGTSFAAPYVAGVAALVRSRFPQLTAEQVMDRIKRTARTPAGGPNTATGYGVVDPVAALSYELPDVDRAAVTNVGRPIAAPPATPPADRHGIAVTAAVLAGLAALAGLAIAVAKRSVQR